jgi:hypothetical protein
MGTKVKRFQLRDGRGNDVLGGPIGEGNATLTMACTGPVVSGETFKNWRQLDVGEGSWHSFAMSGTSGTYYVVRLEDGETGER